MDAQNISKIQKYITTLNEGIEEYDCDLQEINSCKKTLRSELKIMDDDINKLKIDKGS